MKSICPGPLGTVYGVDETGCLLRASEQGGPWTLLPGRYSHIGWSGPSGLVGVDHEMRLVRVTDEGPRPAAKEWSSIRLIDLSVGSDGTIWARDQDGDTGAVRGTIDGGFTVVPGPLDALDGGSFERAYAVAEDGRAFTFDRNGWEPDRRGVRKIVVTGEGARWAIRRDHRIERFTGSEWLQERGLLVNLVAASARRLWGLNKHGHVWNLVAFPESWKKLTGEAREIAADGSGRLATVDGAGVLRELRGAQWWRLRRGVRSVALGPTGEMWIVDGAGSLRQRKEEDWAQVEVAEEDGSTPHGGIRSVSAGQDELWVVGRNGDPWRRHTNDTWKRLSGELLSVAAGNPDSIWGVDLDERAVRWTNRQWSVVAEGVRELDVGIDGEVWGVTRGDRVVRWEPGAGFVSEPGRLRTVAVGHAHYVAGASADDQLFTRRGSTWVHRDVRMTPPEVGPEGVQTTRRRLLGAALACLEIGWRLRLDREFGDVLEAVAEDGDEALIRLPLGGVRDRDRRPCLVMTQGAAEEAESIDVGALPFPLRHRLRLLEDLAAEWGLELLSTIARKPEQDDPDPKGLQPLWARLRWAGRIGEARSDGGTVR